MKTLFSIIIICLGLTMQSHAQNEFNSPKILTQLKIGQAYHVGGKSLKFMKVSSDSRCPKGVTCVWPGEIKIIVGIYEGKDDLSEIKVFEVSPGQEQPVLAEIGDKVFRVFNISPYPKKGETILAEEYQLNLVITSKKQAEGQ